MRGRRLHRLVVVVVDFFLLNLDTIFIDIFFRRTRLILQESRSFLELARAHRNELSWIEIEPAHGATFGGLRQTKEFCSKSGKSTCGTHCQVVGDYMVAGDHTIRLKNRIDFKSFGWDSPISTNKALPSSRAFTYHPSIFLSAVIFFL